MSIRRRDRLIMLWLIRGGILWVSIAYVPLCVDACIAFFASPSPERSLSIWRLLLVLSPLIPVYVIPYVIALEKRECDGYVVIGNIYGIRCRLACGKIVWRKTFSLRLFGVDELYLTSNPLWPCVIVSVI